MKNVSGTADDATETATLAECKQRFGNDVLDVLVTNWIRTHGDNFATARIEKIVKASAIDPAIKASADELATQADAAIEAAKPKEDVSEAAVAEPVA